MWDATNEMLIMKLYYMLILQKEKFQINSLSFCLNL